MNINDIVKIQKGFDFSHGWTPEENLLDIMAYINKDIIGIIGELGEFSNQIKKINLLIDSNKIQDAEELYKSVESNLREEITDTFIYIMRIVSHLNIDLEEEYFKKLNINKEKYRGFDKDEK